MCVLLPSGETRNYIGAQKERSRLWDRSVKQEPAPPGNVATPKASSTVVRRGKGRGQKTSTISVVEAMPEENEYLVEVGEEDLEGSDSDPTELYEILAEITSSEEEI